MNNSIPFGKKDGKLYSPDEVLTGLKCGCVCPACNAKLIACKGDKRKHHFRHQALGYENCGQTAIHLMAKQIIAEEKRIFVPAPKIKDSSVINDYKEINLEKVVLESTDFEGIIPDVVGEYSGKKIFIEIYVSHKVDKQKKEKIRNIDISCLEIDLSDLADSEFISKDELKKAIFEEKQRSVWIFNKKKKELKRKIEKILKQMATQIITKEKRIVVPAPKRENYSVIDSYEEIKLERVILGCRDFEEIAPDIIGEYSGMEIFIEINTCHKIDEQKKETIRNIGISYLEIDLSDFADLESISKDKIRKIIFNQHFVLNWIFNPVYDKRRKKLEEERKEKFKQIVKEK